MKCAAGDLLVLSIAAAMGLIGCETKREPLGRAACPTWKQSVAELLDRRCVACHGSDRAEGAYRLDGYVEAFGVGTDTTPNINARSEDSQILTIFDADDVHGSLRASTKSTLDRWIVDCAAQFTVTSIHEPGIMDPFSDEFHGTSLRSSRYDLASCRDCHGEDYAGGASGVSCLDCHEEGPTDCSTCHADLLELDGHEVHVQGADLEQAYDCEVCHIVPLDLFEPGHVLLRSGELDPPPADVTFSGPALAGGGSPASYRASDRSCSNIYCHDPTGEDDHAERPTPAWDDDQPVDCLSCHGEPPSDHPGETCQDCHPAVADEPGSLVSRTLHLNQSVDFTRDDARCTGCHGVEHDPAPPPDLDGVTSESSPTVGAHQAHLNPERRLAAPVECSECHVVPSRVSSPRHVDSPQPAEVFPSQSGTGQTARADGSMPSYDVQTETCTNTYCHGGGEGLSADESPGKIDLLSWTAPFGQQVYCGSCHGVPPEIPPHYPATELELCTVCHGETVDQVGLILIETIDGVQSSRHINGVVDVTIE